MTFELYKPIVNLVWATPKGDELIGEMARVSIIDNKDKPIEPLIKYLEEHKHNSPFEMVNMCVELFAPRDITRQILRHRSFSFQEFSGRYAEYPDSSFVLREPRLQHQSNRQMSITMNLDYDDHCKTYTQFLSQQTAFINIARASYKEAIRDGIAKEQARCLLPEGNLLSRMYMNGSVRSWVHYLQIRSDKSSVQKEHALIAEAILGVFKEQFPTTYSAFFE